MRRIHNDLSIASYAFVGLLVVGHEVLGPRGAVVAAASLVVLWLAASLLLALADYLRKGPAQTGGAGLPRGH